MNETGDQSGAVERRLSDSHANQISVLRTLNGSVPDEQTIDIQHKAISVPSIGEPKHYKINEIAERCGLKDEKEVQRYLFILEGQKLVSPFPEGDFTSRSWYITKTGVRALKTIHVPSA